MKIKPFKLLGNLLLGAAPVVAGVVGSPAAGVAVGGLMGALGLGKKAGQAIEEKGITVAGKSIVSPGHRPHKAGIPMMAVGLPMLLANFIPADIVDQIQAVACRVCEDPRSIVTIAAGIIGGGTVVWHQITSGLQKSGKQQG